MNDKLMHLLAGVAISLLFGWLAHDALAGFTVALVAGVAKEAYDYFGHGTSDFNDFIATAQGGAIGLIILTVIDFLGVW